MIGFIINQITKKDKIQITLDTHIVLCLSRVFWQINQIKQSYLNINNSKNIEIMNRSNSKQRFQTINSTLTVTLNINSKIITLSAPLPCPASTLKELIQATTHKIYSKIAYFETTNQDWLTDYKIQNNSGWIRGDISLRCVMRNKQDYLLAGMDGYSVLKCIGVGGFSKVYLTRDKIQGVFYAAKFIEKSKLKDKQELIQCEKNINQKISFPFLVNMKDFFQTDQYYIMIIQYCPGGELFNLQRRVVRFEEQQAKKYFLQVLFAIEYLHQKSIVYRDLKPQNIMLDVKGHIKIADFGLAKQIKQKRYSFCGSLEYMSPEILARSGHGFQVDYYCLGALLFQMVVGCPPFYELNSPENETKARIMYQQVEFPSDFDLSQNIKDLIRKLLVKDPKMRIGHLGGTKQIKCHPWIGWLNRQKWISRQIDMPYPVNLDDFNFDCRDITVSANRMLVAINNHLKPKKKSSTKRRQSYLRKTDKISPYRQNQQKRESLTKIKKKLSNSKFYSKGSSVDIVRQKNLSRSKSKDLIKALKACYVTCSSPKANLNKFSRYPTQTGESKYKAQGAFNRQSYMKRDTQMKENAPHREKNGRRRKPKEELIFMQIKRH